MRWFWRRCGEHTPTSPASLAAFCWLTLFLGASNAENETCIYSKNLSTKRSFDISYPEFSPIYKGARSCLWSIQAANRIQIYCDLFIPPSPNCQADYLIVESSSKVQHIHCGYTMFGYVFNETSVSIQFRSPPWSQGGRFFCTVKALKFDDEVRYPCNMKMPVHTELAKGSFIIFTGNRIRVLRRPAVHEKSSDILEDPLYGKLNIEIPLDFSGVETQTTTYPMMCALVNFLEKVPYCGCTIIHEKYVLTAAHCLHNRNLSNIGILVGDNDYTKADDTDASRLYGVEKGMVHPNYDVKKRINDIAVIQVKEWMLFNSRVGPACLPFQHSSDTFAGFVVTVLGWGMMDFGGEVSTKLRKVELDVQTKQQCKKAYPTVNDDQICTYRWKKDSCSMDSGGPVLWENPTSGNMVLVGVINQGINCALVGSVNARVGAYVDWITSVTPDADYNTIE